MEYDVNKLETGFAAWDSLADGSAIGERDKNRKNLTKKRIEWKKNEMEGL